ncbi:MAG TPA: Holliday junction resolvase RuvX [Anaeromyxobacteraceae bacterium]
MRYLGIDLGRARIGLALADDVLRTARPLETLQRRGEAAELARLRQVVEAWEVSRLVVGLPLNMDGTEGGSARLARTFAARLGEALALPVELFDERLSTFEAESRLRERGLSAREQRSVVDAEAAAVILQGWLEARAP